MDLVTLRRIFATLFLAGLFALLTIGSAQAAFGIDYAGGSLSTPTGGFSRQAGEHADLNIHLSFPQTPAGPPDGALRDVKVDLPPGLVGNPTAFPSCELDELVPGGPYPVCPVAAQVGFARIKSDSNLGPEQADVQQAVYNIRRPDNAPALFAFNFGGVAVTFAPRVRPDDYGISSDSLAITQAQPTFAADVTLWGVPADPSHDSERIETQPPFLRGIASPDDPKAFMSNPTSCSGAPLSFSVFADTWSEPGLWVSRSFSADREGTPFLMTGCSRVPFSPSAAVKQQSRAAGAPLGLDVDLGVPQSDAANGLASADVRKTVVTFPKGISISPASASGQGACSEAQIGIGSNAAPTCPDSSRIGTVAIKTPVLDEELEGSLYLAEQGKNPFGSLFAAYLAVKGPGFWLKLPGKIEADAGDGQVTAIFDNLPQLPFETASISLRGGSGAPLVAPSACGTYDAKIEMTSWASPVPVTLDAPITIDQGCGGGGFAPMLKAGTVNPIAGSFSPFLLRVIRSDGEQNVSRIDATLPEGLLAKLAGVPLCGDADAATGACPAASQVGTTTVAVGAGPAPLQVPEAGKAPTAVYLAGPYKGAPYSLVVKVPAQAGPFDLGTVAVRNALRVDPTTTQVRAESDPLPQILQGVPIAYRDVRVEVNRPEFTVNPTNCREQQVTSTLTAAGGATASPSARFQVAGCERLGFKPKLALKLSGQTRRTGHPALKAVLTYPQGGEQANIARAQVNLPRGEFLDQGNLNKTCTKPVLLAGNCPASSIYGKARAWTPLLDKPLEGNVYLVGGYGYKLPALVAELDGQIRVLVVGKVDSGKNKGIRNTFEMVPDAPVSRFELTMKGGKKYGLLENSENLCKAKKAKRRAIARFTGQNGKVEQWKPVVQNQCGKGKKAKRKGGAGRSKTAR